MPIGFIRSDIASDLAGLLSIVSHWTLTRDKEQGALPDAAGEIRDCARKGGRTISLGEEPTFRGFADAGGATRSIFEHGRRYPFCISQEESGTCYIKSRPAANGWGGVDTSNIFDISKRSVAPTDVLARTGNRRIGN